jgi:hypothetical protein
VGMGECGCGAVGRRTGYASRCGVVLVLRLRVGWSAELQCGVGGLVWLSLDLVRCCGVVWLAGRGANVCCGGCCEE